MLIAEAVMELPVGLALTSMPRRPNLTESEGRGPPVSRINYFAGSRLAREVLT
jgi:hypothetical protein